MSESVQYVTILYIPEDTRRLEKMESFRNRYIQTWGHLLNEHGMYWGRELGKHERLWAIVFLKDGHSQSQMLSDPAYQKWKADTDIALPVKLLNVPVRGNMPLHEVLEAGIVILGYYKLAAHRSAARFEELAQRFLDEVDLPGYRGGAYIAPTGLGGDAISFGAWDSVEACNQLGADGRHADLLAETNEAFDITQRTFLTFVKFRKHVMT
ncbi:hypothetical protein PENSPDRAFT_692369 [Peniophora sp. CONT]|nr:hypothetical protein PENSPDRAFT_692369 [Peniophora sp. CONT]